MTPPTMAAWWREAGLHFGQRPPPRIARPDEVSVGIVLTGICRTDVALAVGWLPCPEPRVLGHEVAGLVESIGPGVTRWRPGDRVAVQPLIRGPSGREQRGLDRDGGFAELLVVPETARVRVPDRLDWRRAA